jgi:hypothetical protein
VRWRWGVRIGGLASESDVNSLASLRRQNSRGILWACHGKRTVLHSRFAISSPRSKRRWSMRGFGSLSKKISTGQNGSAPMIAGT